VVKAHLEFFCNAAYEANPSIASDVLLELVLPFAYSTKRKWRTTREAWAVLKGSSLLLKGGCELLEGLEVLKTPDPEAGDGDNDNDKSSPDVEDMVEFNAQLIEKLATNIKSSSDFDKHTTWLVDAMAADSSSRKWPVSFLVATKLIEAVEDGERKQRLVLKVLDALKQSSIGTAAKDLSGDANLVRIDVFPLVQPNEILTEIHTL
jgi:hypothetical protein